MTRRNKVLSHDRFARTRQPDPLEQQLSAVREIAHALVQADRSDEVFEFALDRTSALLGAAFASVYLVEGASELMRLVAATNWPERYRPWLGEMRVRLGFGPSGEAAAERRIIEVPDVLADPGLEDWADVARELGFRSLVALPLQEPAGTLGAVTFYFTEVGSPGNGPRQLMRLVADQMAAAAVKARLVAENRRHVAALAEVREEADRAWRPIQVAAGSDLAEGIVNAIVEPIAALAATRAAGDPRLDQVAARLEDWQQWFALQGRCATLDVEDLVPRDVALAAAALADEWVGGPGVQVKLLPGELAPMRGDRRKITRLLASLLVSAESTAPGRPVVLALSADEASVTFEVRGPAGVTEDGMDGLFDPIRTPAPRVRHQATLAVSRELARSMGGSLAAAASVDHELVLTCRLPLRP